MDELTGLIVGAVLGLIAGLATSALTISSRWFEVRRSERLKWDGDKRRVYIAFIQQANKVEKGLAAYSLAATCDPLDGAVDSAGPPSFAELEYLTEELQLTAPADVSSMGLLLKDHLYCRREILRAEHGLAAGSFMRQSIDGFTDQEFIDRYLVTRDRYITLVQADLGLDSGATHKDWFERAMTVEQRA